MADRHPSAAADAATPTAVARSESIPTLPALSLDDLAKLLAAAVVALYALALLPLATGFAMDAVNRRLIGFHYPDADDRRFVQVVARVVTATAAVVAAIPYLLFFARVFFPVVPPQLGGGAPLPARLVFNHLAVDEARQAGMDVSASGLVSPPLDVVWEEAEWYLVRWRTPAGDATARLDTEMVRAVLVELGGPRPDASATPSPTGTPSP